ncbi:Phosphate transport system permease protein PstA [Fulvivirga imtechensis AK7]|uniref:Phosphate transport system permease protein PstA n=1 Tax=Fulvivirga imtechensis AK7 TaxID=1237149 RepID=L8JYX5_9BACT|nr:ABC transporter permease subunit [Fulvivirga imtechensis]ELR73373.1 Phosphate transport system permease protein PstA [Fulvivirga imtechensis AK7]
MRNTYIQEKVAKVILAIFTLLIVLVLFSILGGIFIKGLPALNWEILTQVPKGGYYFGKEGGILNAIIGSVYLAIGASLIAVVISVPTALFIHTYLFSFPNWQKRIRLCLDVLWGVPPIVYGAFGFNLMLFMGWPTSLLAAIITVAFLISPVMIRAMDESLQQVSHGLFESAVSLGFYKGEIGYKFLLRQTLPGVATAFLLALGKGIGDTASVLFTAGYTDYIPESLTEPAATLPLAVFFQLSSPIPEVKARAYAAAVVLTIIILTISISSRFISKKLSKNKIA